LTDILKVENLEVSFPHKVGFHQSCHGQRGLKLSGMSELTAPYFSKPEQLLNQVKGIELIELDKQDECCGLAEHFVLLKRPYHPKWVKTE
jgi:L-lactate dehydrogenase complex protein LldE